METFLFYSLITLLVIYGILGTIIILFAPDDIKDDYWFSK